MTAIGRNIPVWLDDEDIAWADDTAVRRQAGAAHLPDKHGFQAGVRSGLDIHQQGTRGELAVAKLLGIEWSASVGTFQSGYDVGRLLVRTRSRHDYGLLLRSDDKWNHADDIFVLVFGRPQHRLFTVSGWIVAIDGMRDEYVRSYGNREAAWFVPWEALRPFPIPGYMNEGDHLHAYAKDDDLIWHCVHCTTPYVGPVPVSSIHINGWQG